jgi:hypothetical protein
MKRPAFMFYPADWRKDTALQSCSVAARGTWIDMMCIAHQCDPYGVLAINGSAMGVAQIARLIGETERRTGALLAELENAGVFSRDTAGAIFSRRMVKDEHIRNVRAKAGHEGWQAQSGKRSRGKFARANREQEEGASGNLLEQTLEQKTALSYSSSDVPPIPPQNSSNGKPKRRRQRLPATPCPYTFEVTEDMSVWAQSKGLPADRVMNETEKFINHHRSHGTTFTRWDSAWQNWVIKAVEYGR